MPQLQPITDDHLEYLANLAHEDSLRESFSYFVRKAGIRLDGKPFTFAPLHAYLEEPYRTISDPNVKEVVSEKAAQMGITVMEMLFDFWGMKYGRFPKGVLYLLPTEHHMEKVSKTKIQPIIDENPLLQSWVQRTDSTTQKRIGQASLILHGMTSKLSVKCHDDKTEVLTKGGWEFFKTVESNNEIATRSPSGQFMWQRPTDIYHYPYKGKMFHFKTKNGLDFCVTPNHRLLLINLQGKNEEWIEIVERYLEKPNENTGVVRTSRLWSGEFPDFIDTKRIHNGNCWGKISITGRPKNSRWKHLGNHPDRVFSLRDWVAFIGLYVAEGSCTGTVSGKFTGTVWIAQNRTSKHFKTIKQLLDRMPFDWKYRDKSHSFQVQDIELGKQLFNLGNKYTKKIPEWIINLPKRYLEVLWKFAVMGDGHVSKEKGNTKPHVTYATVSKKLADQFQEILQKCGRSASILIQKESKSGTFPDGRHAKQTTPLYLVSERKSKYSHIPKPEEINYDGEIFCVSVPNGIIYTRRNGYALWSGNSYSVDREALDEVEEVEDWTQVSLARERMSHSEVEWQGHIVKGGSRHLFSVPSVPEYGIDKFFVGKGLDDGRGYEVDPSDQRFWHLQCSHCNEWTCFDEDFPECLIEVNRQTQKAIRVCRGCRQELPLTSKGEWVAKMPGQSTVGYHYSQLFSAYVNPWDILDRFQKKKDLVILYNDKLGLPYVESDARLEIAEVMALCGSQPMLTAFRGPCGMGVDQPKQEGQNFHVTIACKRSDSLRQILFIGIVHTWATVSGLMEKFNVSRCVVDGLPDQSKAREFADTHKNRVFLSYYAEKQKGGHKWNEKDFTVSLDRTETLNTSARDIHEQKVILPAKNAIMSIFAKHCHNMARKSEEDKDTGIVRQTWVKTGPDHFRHAWSYCCVAMEEIAIAPSDNKKRDIPYIPNLAMSYAINLDYRRGQGGQSL